MKDAFGILVYVAIGFLTFAWQYDASSLKEDDRAVVAFLSGLAWPVYWGGTASLGLVRYARSPSVVGMCRDQAGNMWKPNADGVCVIPPH